MRRAAFEGVPLSDLEFSVCIAPVLSDVLMEHEPTYQGAPSVSRREHLQGHALPDQGVPSVRGSCATCLPWAQTPRLAALCLGLSPPSTAVCGVRLRLLSPVRESAAPTPRAQGQVFALKAAVMLRAWLDRQCGEWGRQVRGEGGLLVIGVSLQASGPPFLFFKMHVILPRFDGS